MVATAARRSERSTAPGTAKGTFAAPTRRLARVMRCSMALSPVRNARAISLTLRPETMRKASAICWFDGSTGSQQHEQEAKDVVAIMRIIQPVRHLGFGIAEIRDLVLVGQLLLARFAPRTVERNVAADQNEPGSRITRRAVGGPGLERPEAGLLERLLGRIEVAEVAQERCNRLGPCPVSALSIQPRSVTSCRSPKSIKGLCGTEGTRDGLS